MDSPPKRKRNTPKKYNKPMISQDTATERQRMVRERAYKHASTEIRTMIAPDLLNPEGHYIKEMTPELISNILDAHGQYPISIAMQKYNAHPARVFEWFRHHPDDKARFEHQQHLRAEIDADDIIYIADTEPDMDRIKHRIAARQWVAQKLLHKKYGDKLNIEHTGSVDLRASIDEAAKRAQKIIEARYRKLEEEKEVKQLEEKEVPKPVVNIGRVGVAGEPEDKRFSDELVDPIEVDLMREIKSLL